VWIRVHTKEWKKRKGTTPYSIELKKKGLFLFRVYNTHNFSSGHLFVKKKRVSLFITFTHKTKLTHISNHTSTDSKPKLKQQQQQQQQNKER
jgi:hypothetical protein